MVIVVKEWRGRKGKIRSGKLRLRKSGEKGAGRQTF